MFKLKKEAKLGVDAERVLEEPLLKEAFETLENAYLDGWRFSQPDDTKGRERIHMSIYCIGKVKQHLRSVIANGKLAEDELKRLKKQK